MRHAALTCDSGSMALESALASKAVGTDGETRDPWLCALEPTSDGRAAGQEEANRVSTSTSTSTIRLMAEGHIRSVRDVLSGPGLAAKEACPSREASAVLLIELLDRLMNGTAGDVESRPTLRPGAGDGILGGANRLGDGKDESLGLAVKPSPMAIESSSYQRCARRIYALADESAFVSRDRRWMGDGAGQRRRKNAMI